MRRLCWFLIAAGLALAAEGRGIVEYRISATLVPGGRAVEGSIH